ncbi:hypothetical protein [Actinoplanes derwentensis]|uniref:Uncharacterized protein n=1 Tax=Actinoplanes derwentensis TaxID=113562 RepID=A0A1H2BT74_9ACTN|nr:hypothetical protein [Actinoplanes derwentensis]GID83032.1 hypothetical protein Ade03nite_19560 [Actinoplanes derwentensis]SDT60966.1 hypothetical protein SAMN04489716_4839 [Actinoplanes derwentensis]
MSDEIERLEWDEVKAVVAPMISTWSDGSEVSWAEYAWGVLGAHGLTTYASEIERTYCLLRALAVSAFYLDFCARAFGEGSPDDWRYKVDGDQIGPAPLIDPFTLGQLVEREGMEVDNGTYSDGEQTIEALRDVVAAEYAGVVKALREHGNDAQLFASMFSTSRSGVAYPLPSDQVTAVVDHDLAGDKMYAWMWLTGEL